MASERKAYPMHYQFAVQDRIAQAWAMTKAGLSQAEIATKLNVTPRTVVRYRAIARAAAC